MKSPITGKLTILFIHGQCHNNALKKKRTCLRLPVLFYLNSVSLFCSLLISLRGRAAAMTVTAATESGARLPDTRMRKSAPLQSCTALRVFFGRNPHCPFRIHSLWAQQSSWNPRQEVPAPRVGEWGHVACPSLFQQLPLPASDAASKLWTGL